MNKSYLILGLKIIIMEFRRGMTNVLYNCVLTLQALPVVVITLL